jgi:hypothetical protein
MILELLPFGGFFAHFDFAGLNQRPSAISGGITIPPVDFSSLSLYFMAEKHSSGRFLVYELVTDFTADCHIRGNLSANCCNPW